MAHRRGELGVDDPDRHRVGHPGHRSTEISLQRLQHGHGVRAKDTLRPFCSRNIPAECLNGLLNPGDLLSVHAEGKVTGHRNLEYHF
jgi:hypothetical protein